MSDARTTARLRFPPWQVCELQGGYAVEDAEGRRLGTFYGKPDPLEAQKAGLLTLDEARQAALDFAQLVELLNRSLDAEGERKAAPAAPRHTHRSYRKHRKHLRQRRRDHD
jgi:hypothetical protein